MYLPRPPDDGEKYCYVNQRKLFFYSFGSISFVLLTLGMLKFALANPYLVIYLAFVSLVSFYLLISYVVGIFGGRFRLEDHRKIVEKHPKYVPSVDVYIPNCGEPLQILANTFQYARSLDYPNFRVYCLDDKGKSEVQDLAGQYGITYLSRPNLGELKKSGNVRYAFAETSGELILILDADFVPRPDMLKELVPYFAEHPDAAIVQSPQYFDFRGEQTWVQKGAAYIQELFYRLIQVNRNKWGASICVGTCALYRRAALEPIGGTYPIGHSEDVHTGFSCISRGYSVHYVPINLAKGACPDTLQSFFNQQYRWATGSTTLMFNPMFWKTRLGVYRRICYLSGMLYYSATALGIFLQPVPGMVMVWFFSDWVFWWNTFFSVPSFIFGHIMWGIWSIAPLGLYAFRTRLVSYYAHLFAVKDRLADTTQEWVATGSVAATKTSSNFDRFRRLSFGWASLSTAIIVAGAFRCMGQGQPFYHFVPILFFAGWNYFITMTILRDQ